MSEYLFIGTHQDPAKRIRVIVSHDEYQMVLKRNRKSESSFFVRDLETGMKVWLRSAYCGLPGCRCALEYMETAPALSYPIGSRELATILAALRYWQRALEPAGIPPTHAHFQEHDAMTCEQIDELCERLNCGGK